MLFPLKVNFALAKLGVNPQHIRSEYRQGAQAVGKAAGNSPQEVALFIASQLPVAYQIDLNPFVVKGWIRERKINIRDPEIKNSLLSLGWGELLAFD